MPRLHATIARVGALTLALTAVTAVTASAMGAGAGDESAGRTLASSINLTACFKFGS